MIEIKELSRLTVCTLFQIRAPMWLGSSKKRAVGLDKGRVSKHNEIRFTYVRKSDGELSMPDPYYFDGNLVKQIDFEYMNRKGTTLLIVPMIYLKKLVRI